MIHRSCIISIAFANLRTVTYACALLFAGEAMTRPLAAQQIRPLVRPGFVFQAPKPVSPEELQEVLLETRGLIQNELDVVGRICKLSNDQSRSLVDAVETEWLEKTGDMTRQRLQRNWQLSGEIDGVVERAMQQWVVVALPPDQAKLYEDELSDRLAFRKQVVVTQLLVTLQQKLELTNEQVLQVEKVLEEKWKDRWYRTIEGVYDGEGLHPEINRVWLEEILTASQRKALSHRSQLARTNGRPPEYPRKSFSQRFSLNGMESKAELSTIEAAEPLPLLDKK